MTSELVANLADKNGNLLRKQARKLLFNKDTIASDHNSSQCRIQYAQLLVQMKILDALTELVEEESPSDSHFADAVDSISPATALAPNLEEQYAMLFDAAQRLNEIAVAASQPPPSEKAASHTPANSMIAEPPTFPSSPVMVKIIKAARAVSAAVTSTIKEEVQCPPTSESLVLTPNKVERQATPYPPSTTSDVAKPTAPQLEQWNTWEMRISSTIKEVWPTQSQSYDTSHLFVKQIRHFLIRCGRNMKGDSTCIQWTDVIRDTRETSIAIQARAKWESGKWFIELVAIKDIYFDYPHTRAYNINTAPFAGQFRVWRVDQQSLMNF